MWHERSNVTQFAWTNEKASWKVSQLEARFETQLLFWTQTLETRTELFWRSVLELAVVATENEADTARHQQKLL